MTKHKNDKVKKGYSHTKFHPGGENLGEMRPKAKKEALKKFKKRRRNKLK